LANETTVVRLSQRLATLLVAATIVLGGCAPDQPASSTDKDIVAIEAVIDGLTKAYVARDWDSFAQFFAEDGVWMPPGVEPLSGKAAWWEWVQPWWGSSTVVNIGVSTQDLVVIDDWAIERHVEYQSTIFGDAEAPTTLNFKGVWIFHRQKDGSWKIAQYIWNENNPSE